MIRLLMLQTIMYSFSMVENIEFQPFMQYH